MILMLLLMMKSSNALDRYWQNASLNMKEFRINWPSGQSFQCHRPCYGELCENQYLKRPGNSMHDFDDLVNMRV